jgi:hypothetical protein
MSDQNLEPGNDPVNYEMRYSITGEDGLIREVRISRTARTEAKPSPEQRIDDWYSYHPLPEAGTSTPLPDNWFNPHYF